MTQQEYDKAKEECWEDFCRKFLPEADSEATMKDVIDYAFDRAYALGKQEKDAGTVIQGWVAPDEDGTLILFYGSNKPSKEDGDDYWSVAFGSNLEHLNQDMFPDVTWEDAEPEQVEIIIKRKEK